MDNLQSSDSPKPAPSPVMDDADGLEERLAFLELTADDARRLRELKPLYQGHVDELVEKFYAHLFSFEETARFLGDAALVARLKKSQQAHFESMFDAAWNDDYVHRRRRVGDAHASIGIRPQFFLGAYNQYLQFSLRALSESMPGATPQFLDRVGTLLKAVLLDVGLTLDAYFEEATQSLRAALDMLLQANTDLRQFAQFTSHDLKTPLATVINLCDEALDEFGPEMPAEAQRLVKAARDHTFRMSSTIDELLSASIVMAPAKELVRISTAKSLHEAVERVRPLLDERRIALSLPSDSYWVAGNHVRLREAFYNLLSNAAKFIDKSPGRIAIECERHGPECWITIADNGPGIPGDELQRIFVPFRRLPIHRDKPGSGLGLYFTKTLIEQQGGRVWAESQPGEGSRFTVALKRFEAAE